MNENERLARLESRIVILESMGFKIYHRDSQVGVPIGGGAYTIVDFSATPQEKFIERALQVVHDEAFHAGQNALREHISKLMKPTYPEN